MKIVEIMVQITQNSSDWESHSFFEISTKHVKLGFDFLAVYQVLQKYI